jgi:cytochrome b
MASSTSVSTKDLQAYPVWDRTTRLFHWINAITVLGLIAVGLVILNGKLLGISGEGKVLLKTLHVSLGYVFALNLAWRFIWGFIGNRYARWSAILPLGRGYFASIGEYLRSMRSPQPIVYAGHNPIARLMVGLLLLLLSVQAVTGLVLAGTDIYYPPLGETVKTWIVADGSQTAQIVAGSKEHIDQTRYQAMRNFREPFWTVHVYSFYILLGAIAIHLLGVIATELRERSGLVSAMIHGRKTFTQKPKDN